MNLESSNLTLIKSSKANFWFYIVLIITIVSWVLFAFFLLFPAYQKNNEILSPLMIAVVTFFIVSFFMTHYHQLKEDYLSHHRTIQGAVDILEDYRSIKKEDLDLIKRRFKNLALPIIYDIWQEFDKTLVKNETTGEVNNTHQIELFFNESRLMSKFIHYENIPSILTGSGLCGTFISIAFALHSFDVNDLEKSTNSLLSGLAYKFGCSLCGIFTALIFTFSQKVFREKLDKPFHTLHNKLNSIFPRVTAEGVLVEILRVQNELNTEIKTSLSDNNITKAISAALSNQNAENKVSLQGLIQDLKEGLLNHESGLKKELLEKIDCVNDHLSLIANNYTNTTEKIANSMINQLEGAINSLNNSLSQSFQSSMESVTNQINDNFQTANGSFQNIQDSYVGLLEKINDNARERESNHQQLVQEHLTQMTQNLAQASQETFSQIINQLHQAALPLQSIFKQIHEINEQSNVFNKELIERVSDKISEESTALFDKISVSSTQINEMTNKLDEFIEKNISSISSINDLHRDSTEGIVKFNSAYQVLHSELVQLIDSITNSRNYNLDLVENMLRVSGDLTSVSNHSNSSLQQIGTSMKVIEDLAQKIIEIHNATPAMFHEIDAILKNDLNLLIEANKEFVEKYQESNSKLFTDYDQALCNLAFTIDTFESKLEDAFEQRDKEVLMVE